MSHYWLLLRGILTRLLRFWGTFNSENRNIWGTSLSPFWTVLELLKGDGGLNAHFSAPGTTIFDAKKLRC